MTWYFCWLDCRYCYQEEVGVDRDIALATLYAAKKYILPCLEEGCRKSLVERLAPANIWEVYTSSITRPDDKLRSSCQEYFESNISDVLTALKSSAFRKLPYHVLLDLMQLNDSDRSTPRILVPDIEIFKACNAWGRAECVRQELEPSGENRRKVLGDCLFLISFRTMLARDLVDVVFPAEILNQDEKSALLECTHGAFNSKIRKRLRFVSRWDRYVVEIQRLRNAESFLEYSPMKETEIEYSSVCLVPNTSLILFGVGCSTNQDHKTQTKHEISIKANSNEHRWTKSVVSYSWDVGSENQPFKFLLFPEQHLEADCEYQIKVEKHGSNCNEDEGHLRYPILDKKNKLPEQVGLEVRGKENNDCIKNFLIRLV